MKHDPDQIEMPSLEELKGLGLQKYGEPESTGWSPRQRSRFGYYLPADRYEALVQKLVFEGCAWVDVGGGHDIFPENPELARTLVSRSSLAVAVDPSDNIEQNEFVHRRSKCLIEDYETDERFDLATLRMVAEHVSDPATVLKSLHRLLRPGGVAVVFTVNKWSPISLISRWTPFRLHHIIKKLFWGGEEEDTFPVEYKMNRRKTLRRLFEQHGFREAAFAHLDDLAMFGRFRWLNFAELSVWKLLRWFGLRYPENCLLGVYERVACTEDESRLDSCQVAAGS